MDFKLNLVAPQTFKVSADNIVKIEPPQESLVVKSTETQQEIIAKDKLFNKVTVKNWNLQEKIVKPLEEEILVIPDADYDALKSVTIEPMPAQPSGEIELTKNGTYDVKQYATAVVNVSVGEEKDINFYDYDGTLLYAYSFNEAKNLQELPIPPEKDLITFNGWTHLLSDILSTKTKLDIMPYYYTKSGKTEIDVEMTEASGLTQSFNMSSFYERAVIIDWGDGTIEQMTENNGVKHSHTYSDYGEYTILVDADFTDTSRTGTVYTISKYGQSESVPNVSIKSIRFSSKCYYSGSNKYAYCYNLEKIAFTSKYMPQDGDFDYCLTLKVVSTNRNQYYRQCRMCVNLIASATSKDTYAIGDRAYQYCVNLKKISLYKESKIMTGAFTGCVNCILYDCRNYTTVPTLQDVNAFFGINPNAKIVVPDELYESWITATNWSAYAKYIVKASEYVEE